MPTAILAAVIACRAGEPQAIRTADTTVATVHAAPDTSGHVYFGMIDPSTRMENPGDGFAGYYSTAEKRFVSQPQSYSESASFPLPLPGYLAAFPVQRALAGVDSGGTSVRVVIDSLVRSMGDLYTGQIAAHVENTSTPARYPVLFWTTDARISIVSHAPVTLDSSDAKRLRIAAESLFAAALRDGDPEVPSGVRLELGEPRAERVEGVDSLAVVTFQPILRSDSPERADSSASVFMLYAPAQHRIVFSRFGHPGWSANAKQVVEIAPILYFRIGSDPRTYFFGYYWGPWEDNGFGIVDLASGKLLLRT